MAMAHLDAYEAGEFTKGSWSSFDTPIGGKRKFEEDGLSDTLRNTRIRLRSSAAESGRLQPYAPPSTTGHLGIAADTSTAHRGVPQEKPLDARISSRPLPHIGEKDPALRNLLIGLIDFTIASRPYDAHAYRDFVSDLIKEELAKLQINSAEETAKEEAIRMLIASLGGLLDGPAKIALARVTFVRVAAQAKLNWKGYTSDNKEPETAASASNRNSYIVKLPPRTAYIEEPGSSETTIKQEPQNFSDVDVVSETHSAPTTIFRNGTRPSAWLRSGHTWSKFINRAGVWDQRSMPKAPHWGHILNGMDRVAAIFPKRLWTQEQLANSATPVLDLLYGDHEIPDTSNDRRSIIHDIVLGLRARCGPSLRERYTDSKRRSHNVELNMKGTGLGGDLVRISRRQLEKRGLQEGKTVKGVKTGDWNSELARAEYERLLRWFVLANEKDFPELAFCDKRSWQD